MDCIFDEWGNTNDGFDKLYRIFKEMPIGTPFQVTYFWWEWSYKENKNLTPTKIYKGKYGGMLELQACVPEIYMCEKTKWYTLSPWRFNPIPIRIALCHIKKVEADWDTGEVGDLKK